MIAHPAYNTVNNVVMEQIVILAIRVLFGMILIKLVNVKKVGIFLTILNVIHVWLDAFNVRMVWNA
jgi:hypothetical protein